MGNRIRELRKQRKLSFDDVARRIGNATSASTIQKLENGTMQLTLTWMEKLADAFGVEVTEILAPPPPNAAPISDQLINSSDVVPHTGQHAATDYNLVDEPGALYRVTSPALEELGLMPGDVVRIAPIATTRELTTGDIVIAQSIAAKGEAEFLIAREFIEPNLLITNARHDNARPVHLAAGLVRILGRVIAAHRNVAKSR